MTLGPKTKLVRNPAINEASLGQDETALLSTVAARYYSLEGPASRIWELLKVAQTPQTICDTLLGEFEITDEACRSETMDFLNELMSENLVLAVED